MKLFDNLKEIKRLKELRDKEFELYKENEASFIKEIQSMSQRILGLEKNNRKPEYFLESILDRKISFIDYSKMNEEQLMSWYNDAQNILKNRVFQSLCGKINDDGTRENGELVKDWIEALAKTSQNWEQVRDIRIYILALEFLRDKIASIPRPQDLVKEDDLL